MGSGVRDRPGTTTSEAEQLAQLERENRSYGGRTRSLVSAECLRDGAGRSVAMKVEFVDSGLRCRQRQTIAHHSRLRPHAALRSPRR